MYTQPGDSCLFNEWLTEWMNEKQTNKYNLLVWVITSTF